MAFGLVLLLTSILLISSTLAARSTAAPITIPRTAPTQTPTPAPISTTGTFLSTPVGSGTAINILLTDKSTNQTGAWYGLTSDKAVDGKVYSKQDGNKYCAHPDNTDDGQPAEWWIDLEQIYLIHNVTLYNTGDSAGYKRMQNFSIRVYSAGIQSALTCAEYPGRVASASSTTLTCPSNTQGQYVQFIRLGGWEIDKVTICEVEITGQRYPASLTSAPTKIPGPAPTQTPTPALISTTGTFLSTPVGSALARSTTCSCLLSWLLFGFACVISIISTSLLAYFYRRQKMSEQRAGTFSLQNTQATSQTVIYEVTDDINTRPLPNMSKSLTPSGPLDGAISQLTTDNTGDYEDVTDIVKRRDNTEVRRQYEDLQRQTTDDRNRSHYESMH